MHRAARLRSGESARLVSTGPSARGDPGLDAILHEAKQALSGGPASTLRELRWECDARGIGPLLDYEIKSAFRSAHRSPSAGGAARSRELDERSLEPSDLLSDWVEKDLLSASRDGGVRRELEKAIDIERFRAALVGRAKEFLRRPSGSREKRKRISFRRLSRVLNLPPFAQRVHGKFDARAPFTRDMTKRLNAIVDGGALEAVRALRAESGLVPALLAGEREAISLAIGGAQVAVTRADLSVRTLAWSRPGAPLEAHPFAEADLLKIGGAFVAAREKTRLLSALDDAEALLLATMLTADAEGYVTPDHLWAVLDQVHSPQLDATEAGRSNRMVTSPGSQEGGLTHAPPEPLEDGEAHPPAEEGFDWDLNLREGSIALMTKLTEPEIRLLALLHENEQLRGEALASACGVSKTMVQRRKRTILKKAAEAVAEHPSEPSVADLELIHAVYYAVQELAFRAVETGRVDGGTEAEEA